MDKKAQEVVEKSDQLEKEIDEMVDDLSSIDSKEQEIAKMDEVEADDDIELLKEIGEEVEKIEL